MICDNKIIHIREQVKHHDLNNHNYVWHTFKKGDIVPEELRILFLNQGGKAILQKQLKLKEKEEVKEEPKEVKHEWTEETLFALNRDEQISMLLKMGVDKIPRYEKSRVKLILKLLKGE